ETRREQRRPKPISWPGKVMAGPTGIKAGIDPAKEHFKLKAYHVRHSLFRRGKQVRFARPNCSRFTNFCCLSRASTIQKSSNCTLEIWLGQVSLASAWNQMSRQHSLKSCNIEKASSTKMEACFSVACLVQ